MDITVRTKARMKQMEDLITLRDETNEMIDGNFREALDDMRGALAELEEENLNLREANKEQTGRIHHLLVKYERSEND